MYTINYDLVNLKDASPQCFNKLVSISSCATTHVMQYVIVWFTISIKHKSFMQMPPGHVSNENESSPVYPFISHARGLFCQEN